MGVRLLFCALSVGLAGACEGPTDDAGPRILLEGVAEPGGAPGPAGVVAFGPDGTTYARASADATGAYSLAVPETVPFVLLAAIDPSDPNRQAFAWVDTSLGSSAAPLTRGDLGAAREALGVRCDINALSSGEFMFRLMANRLDTSQPLAPPDVAVGEALGGATINAVCDGVFPTVLDPVELGDLGTEELSTLRNETIIEVDVLDALTAAQERITQDVSSSNQLEGLASAWFAPAAVFTQQTRNVVNMLTAFSGGSFYPDTPTPGTPGIPDDRVEAAARVIMASGWGNCREKAIAAAYAATQLDDIRSVVILGVDRDYSLNTHSVALACTTEDPPVDVWQGQTLTEERTIATGMLDAGCIVVDPWDGTTFELTEMPAGWKTIADFVAVLEDGVVPPPPVVPTSGQQTTCSSGACEPFDPGPATEEVVPPGPSVGRERTITVCGFANGDVNLGCEYFGRCTGECDIPCLASPEQEVRVSGSVNYPIFDILRAEAPLPYDSFSVRAAEGSPLFAIRSVDGAALPRVIQFGDAATQNARPSDRRFRMGGLPPLRTGVRYRAEWSMSSGPPRAHGVWFFLGSGDCHE